MQTLTQEMKEQSADLTGLSSPFCQVPRDLHGMCGSMGMLNAAQNKEQSYGKKQSTLEHNTPSQLLGTPCRLPRLATESC